MLRKPLLGGVFGSGQYELATQPIVANGLHAVKYFVLEPRAGRVLAIAESKLEALGGARRLLASIGPTSAPQEPVWLQPPLWSDGPLSAVDVVAPTRHVSRRRREIFERSGGRCHYCPQVLTLEGKWHIEHMQPKALGGTDDALNLVAACVRCNLMKGERTAIEFVAGALLARPGRSA